jgi:hypothetical protein
VSAKGDGCHRAAGFGVELFRFGQNISLAGSRSAAPKPQKRTVTPSSWSQRQAISRPPQSKPKRLWDWHDPQILRAWQSGLHPQNFNLFNDTIWRRDP